MYSTPFLIFQKLSWAQNLSAKKFAEWILVLLYKIFLWLQNKIFILSIFSLDELLKGEKVDEYMWRTLYKAYLFKNCK